MQVTETNSEGLSREYQVSLPSKDIEDKISHRLKEIAATASVPGFRPGKVPVSMLRKRYGPSIMGEILERAVGDSSQQAMAEKGVRPATQPEIEITSFEDGKDLEYTIKLEVIPEIEPVDYSALKLERLNPISDDEQVNTALQNIASANKTTAPIKTKRKCKSGDILVIDFVGSVDGEEFAGGKADDYQLELGSNSFIPGFEDQLIGLKAGDDSDVNVKFPDEYGAADLAGKDALFKVTVKEILEGTPAEIDDELAKKLGLESLEKLKETIIDEQGREFKQFSRMRLKRTLLDQLADSCSFETPKKMVESEYTSIWEQYEEQKKQAAESGDDAAQDDDDLNEEDQRAEFQQIAERRVRLGLLLSEIGKDNNIQILQEDITKAITEEARKYPGQEQAVMEYYQSNPEQMQQLSAPLYEEKVVDFILEMATVNEKDVTGDELMKILEADNEDAEKKATKAKPKAKAKAKAKDSDDTATTKKAAPKKKAATSTSDKED